jgi:hypothetical protein
MTHFLRVPAVALFVSALTLLWTLGCATASFQAGEPFAPGEARFFDDGIDLIENLESLSGEWGYRAQDDLSGRVQLADLVAVVDIVAVQLSQDVEGKESRRIDLQLKESLLGKSPGDILSLSASEEPKRRTQDPRVRPHHKLHFVERVEVMARKPRIDVPGPSHHVMHSGGSADREATGM